MFEAQLLIAKDTVNYEVFSPWFPRQGDDAKFTIETIDQDGEPSLDVSVYTKSSETVGNGTITAGGATMTASLTAGANIDADWAGILNELVRYHFEISGNAGDWILFRMLPPVWFDSVHAP